MSDDPDEALLERVRSGDINAFHPLYERHIGSARRFAWSLCRNDHDADDIVAEAFTSLLTALGRGHGPDGYALPYLFSSIRRRYGRSAGQAMKEQRYLGRIVERESASNEDTLIEIDIMRAALASLPPDVQRLLWRTEVNDEHADDIRGEISARRLAVDQHRARRALGTAYLVQHSEPDGGVEALDPECREVVPHLARLVRNKVKGRRRQRLEDHLSGCDICSKTERRLAGINDLLRLT